MSNTTPQSPQSSPSPAPDAPVRLPLSLLKPPASVRRTAERCAGLLRHPRARIRVTPGWQAPSSTVVLPAGTATVFVSRHRVSPAMWRKLTKADVDTVAPGSPLHLVTLSAVTETDHLHGTLRDMTVSVHSLFRQILAPGPGNSRDTTDARGPEWIGAESCGRLHPDGKSLEWTWHALLTEEQLERKKSAGSRGSGTGADPGEDVAA